MPFFSLTLKGRAGALNSAVAGLPLGLDQYPGVRRLSWRTHRDHQLTGDYEAKSFWKRLFDTWRGGCLTLRRASNLSGVVMLREGHLKHASRSSPVSNSRRSALNGALLISSSNGVACTFPSESKNQQQGQTSPFGCMNGCNHGSRQSRVSPGLGLVLTVRE